MAFLFQLLDKIGKMAFEWTNIYDFLSIFIHETQETNTIKNRVFRKIQVTNKGLAHAVIVCFWVNDSIEKTGLGKILMMHTEVLLKKSRGNMPRVSY